MKIYLELYDAIQLYEMPTLSQGQAHDLKVDGFHAGVPTRWWLSRITVQDGETHAIHVEQCIDGRWVDVHAYGRPRSEK